MIQEKDQKKSLNQEILWENYIPPAVIVFSLFIGALICTKGSLSYLLLLGSVSVIFYVVTLVTYKREGYYVYLLSAVFILLEVMITLETKGNLIVQLNCLIFLYSLTLFNRPQLILYFSICSWLASAGLHLLIQETSAIQDLEKSSPLEQLVVSIIYVASTMLAMVLSSKIRFLKESNLFLEKKVSQLEENKKQNIAYAENISMGNFDCSFDINLGDSLSTSLVEMSRNLKRAAMEEKERTWTIGGIAQISDIVRINHTNIEALSYSIISFLVKYLQASQGGIFLLSEQDDTVKHLELKACYAYDKKKFLQKKVEIGEGLLGQAYLEKEIVYLTDVPEHYIKITSGLGETTPRSVIIVPLRLDQEVVGIIEIASFKEFKAFEQEFLKKVSENIASALISARIKTRTDNLLLHSNEIMEEMRTQEEELKQNKEELKAIQESFERESLEKTKIQHGIEKTKEFLKDIINALPEPIFVKDRKHNIILINKAFTLLNNINETDVMGKNDFDLFPKEEAQMFFDAEEILFKERKEFIKEEKATINGKISFRLTHKKIIESKEGELYLVGVNHDITNQKNKETTLLTSNI